MAEKQKKESKDIMHFHKSAYHMISKVSGIVVIVLLAVLLYLAVVKGYQLGYQVFSTEEYGNTVGKTITFTVKEGESTKEVANRLEKEGLIEDAFVFRIQTVIFQKVIVPGTYELGNGMSSREILGVLNHTE